MRDYQDGRRASGGTDDPCRSTRTAGTTRRSLTTATRGAAALLSALLLLALGGPLGAAAADKPKGKDAEPGLYIPQSLLEQAESSPKAPFEVIVQGDGGKDAAKVAKHIATYAVQAERLLSETAKQADLEAQSRKLLQQQIKDRLSSIDGVSATLTGKQISRLVDRGDGLLSITPDAPVALSGGWNSRQRWAEASGVTKNWDADAKLAKSMPAIAIVDSGVESRADFGGRLIASVDLTSLPNNSPGDGRGHGTFVAGIAAGAATDYAGAAPAAKIVSLDVMDDNGMGLTSDIILACQWIIDHTEEYDIRVANFSLHSTTTAPFYLDPLDRAVEQLWFNGIVVVTAAGNYGSPGGPSGVRYSPSNDPFVITVGALDLGKDAKIDDDTTAPWSAWGTTLDGFAKPELAAPGRYIVGPVPAGSTLVSERPAYVVGSGYMQLSGTSFAAPTVAGAAASLLARHPELTPDEVKGALMLTARTLKHVRDTSSGVGALTADKLVGVKAAPNPNLALDRYVRSASGGSGLAFDSASWNSTARGDASWNSASWNSASWNSASWNSASWNSASWNSASWNSASWNSASWNSNAYGDRAANDAVVPASMYHSDQSGEEDA